MTFYDLQFYDIEIHIEWLEPINMSGKVFQHPAQYMYMYLSPCKALSYTMYWSSTDPQCTVVVQITIVYHTQ